jgi:4-carboxymuconolactone decarboxylase
MSQRCDLVQRGGACVRFGSSIPPRLNEMAIIMAGRKRLELLATGSVSDAAVQRVENAFGARGVVDLVVAVGYYSLVSMTLNVAQVPLPAGVSRL